MSDFSVFISVLVKILFLITIPLQVMIWPSVATICFACVYGIIGISHYFFIEKGGTLQAFLMPGVYLFRNQKQTSNYVFMLIMALHFSIYFILFISHEVSILPAATLWLDKSLWGNYSADVYTPLPVEVTSEISKNMRDTPFVWSKSVSIPAPLITGSIPGLGPNKNDLVCGTSSPLGFKCYGKVWNTQTPSSLGPTENVFIPLSSEFYNVDVMISPGSGKKCSDLEVYRVVVNNDLSVVHPLDYPASTIASSSAARSLLYPLACNLFKSNASSTFCLQTQHTFTQEQYTQEIASMCTRFNQKLIFRLPERANDVDAETGRHRLDVLLVSDSAASVELHASWKQQNQSDWFLFFSIWNQVVDSDQIQGWRESTEGAAVFFKFAIAVIPLAVTWYYLASEFIIDHLPESQITFLTVFIQLPSILLFLSMGAWLPMAGCIICVLAVNYGVQDKKYWSSSLRPLLLFITAVCNSVQFAWILALVGEAGWSAFYYALTLDQLYDISYKFIITNQSSPTWIALMLPIILMVNGSFLLGSAICVVLETMARSSQPKP